MNINIIHLKKDFGRFVFIEKINDMFSGDNIKIIEGEEPNFLKNGYIEEYISKKKDHLKIGNNKEYEELQFGGSTRGASEAHMKAIELSNSYTLIFEDDVLFNINFKEGIEKVKNFIDEQNNFNILYLGLTNYEFDNEFVDKFKITNINTHDTLHGVYGYVINNKNKEQILNRIKKNINKELDINIFDHYITNSTAFVIDPPLVIPNIETSNLRNSKNILNPYKYVLIENYYKIKKIPFLIITYPLFNLFEKIEKIIKLFLPWIEIKILVLDKFVGASHYKEYFSDYHTYYQSNYDIKINTLIRKIFVEWYDSGTECEEVFGVCNSLIHFNLNINKNFIRKNLDYIDQYEMIQYRPSSCNKCNERTCYIHGLKFYESLSFFKRKTLNRSFNKIENKHYIEDKHIYSTETCNRIFKNNFFLNFHNITFDDLKLDIYQYDSKIDGLQYRIKDITIWIDIFVNVWITDFVYKINVAFNKKYIVSFNNFSKNKENCIAHIEMKQLDKYLFDSAVFRKNKFIVEDNATELIVKYGFFHLIKYLGNSETMRIEKLFNKHKHSNYHLSLLVSFV